MVLSPEIMIPPRRNSFETSSSSPPKSHWWFFTSKLKTSTNGVFGSTHTVATQKLRESKWFDQDEERLFCAVIEGGFIVEIMQKDRSLMNDDDELKSHFGIVSVEVKKSKFKLNICYHLRSRACELICYQTKKNHFLPGISRCFQDKFSFLTFERLLAMTMKVESMPSVVFI